MGFKLNVQLNCTAEVCLDGAGQQDKRELGERDMAKGNGTGSGSGSVAELGILLLLFRLPSSVWQSVSMATCSLLIGYSMC